MPVIPINRCHGKFGFSHLWHPLLDSLEKFAPPCINLLDNSGFLYNSIIITETLKLIKIIYHFLPLLSSTVSYRSPRSNLRKLTPDHLCLLRFLLINLRNLKMLKRLQRIIRNKKLIYYNCWSLNSMLFYILQQYSL